MSDDLDVTYRAVAKFGDDKKIKVRWLNKDAAVAAVVSLVLEKRIVYQGFVAENGVAFREGEDKRRIEKSKRYWRTLGKRKAEFFEIDELVKKLSYDIKPEFLKGYYFAFEVDPKFAKFFEAAGASLGTSEDFSTILAFSNTPEIYKLVYALQGRTKIHVYGKRYLEIVPKYPKLENVKRKIGLYLGSLKFFELPEEVAENLEYCKEAEEGVTKIVNMEAKRLGKVNVRVVLKVGNKVVVGTPDPSEVSEAIKKTYSKDI